MTIDIDKFIPEEIENLHLTNEEILEAEKIAIKRQIFSDGKNKDRYNFKGNGNKIHRMGCIAEIAVAKWLGAEWTGFSEDFKNLKYDVGRLQVRSTDFKFGRLFLHPKDHDDQIYVLVRIHQLPNIQIIGWILGEDAKNIQYWKELKPGRPCFVVPTNKLSLMKDLNKEDYRRE